MAAQTLKIDRMVLRIPGTSADQGREVARLVAAALANAGALPQFGELPSLRVTLGVAPGADPTALARRIVEATLRDLARMP